VFCLVGIAGLLMVYLFKRPFIPFLTESSYFVLLFNGVIWIFMIRDSMKKEKYFVSWSDSEINFLLPKSDKEVSVRIDNIKSLKISRSNIEIGLINNESRHFNLNYFFFPERQVIIDFFEDINRNLIKTP
jgi:hypothetical protein